MILRCTAKLLKLLGQPSDPAASGDEEQEWYANLLWFARRKCLLVTHATTLFTVFLPDVRKADLVPIGPFVVQAIEHMLAVEDLPPDTFGALDEKDVRLAKTASRSVLGSMNDMAFSIEHGMRMGPWPDVEDLNHWLNSMIHGPTGYRSGLDLAAERALRLRGMSTN